MSAGSPAPTARAVVRLIEFYRTAISPAFPPRRTAVYSIGSSRPPGKRCVTWRKTETPLVRASSSMRSIFSPATASTVSAQGRPSQALRPRSSGIVPDRLAPRMIPSRSRVSVMSGWAMLTASGKQFYGNNETTFANYWHQYSQVYGKSADASQNADGSVNISYNVTVVSGTSSSQTHGVTVQVVSQNGQLLINSDTHYPG